MKTQKDYHGKVNSLIEHYKDSKFSYTVIDLNTKEQRFSIAFYGQIPKELIGKYIFVVERILKKKGEAEIHQTLRKDPPEGFLGIETETTLKGKSLLNKLKSFIN